MNTHLSTLRPALTRCLFILLCAATLAVTPTSRAQVLYVAQTSGRVGTYNPATGAAINANFISGPNNGAFGITVAGNKLFLSDHIANKVLTFNATTGAVISNPFIGFLPGELNDPTGIVISGNDLYLVDTFKHRIERYDATTGGGINLNLVTGLGLPISMDIFGTDLFVESNGSQPALGRYNATTGAVINENFIPVQGIRGLKIAGNDLYVLSQGGSVLGRYNATTGAAINANLITQLNGGDYIEVLGNDLFVSENSANRVGRYNATTGEPINPNFITGLSGPAGLAIMVPEPGTLGLALLGGLALLRRRRVR